jgi:hypothetical protein
MAGLGVLLAAGGASYFMFFKEGSAQNRSSGKDDKDEDEDRDEDEDGENGNPRQVASSSASEVDDPDDFEYLEESADCSEYRFFSDPAKELGEKLNNMAKEATKVSFEVEREYGDQWLLELTDMTGGQLVHSGPMVDYLGAVAKPLLQHLERDDTRYDFHLLVDSGMENALALPGGHIVFTQELLDNWIENEAQVATVLGHEIAHVEKRHSAALIGYLLRLGLDPNEELSRILVGVGSLPFSSKQEEEADRVGAGMLHKAGYSAFQAVVMWEEVADRTGSSSVVPEEEMPEGMLGEVLKVGLGEIQNIVSSHPDSDRRACLLKQVAFDLYEDDPLETAYRGESNWENQKPFTEKEY